VRKHIKKTFIWQKKSVHIAKETYSYGKRDLVREKYRPSPVKKAGTSKRPSYGPKNLFILQKRPIHNKRDLFIWQKRPIHMAKETYSYGKTDLAQ
jgi:hypothetical protein